MLHHYYYYYYYDDDDYGLFLPNYTYGLFFFGLSGNVGALWVVYGPFLNPWDQKEDQTSDIWFLQWTYILPDSLEFMLTPRHLVSILFVVKSVTGRDQEVKSSTIALDRETPDERPLGCRDLFYRKRLGEYFAKSAAENGAPPLRG